MMRGLSAEAHHTPDQRRMPLKVMKSSSELLLLCVLTSLSPLLPAWAFSQGAKPSSCVSMEPGHIRAHPQDPRHSHVALHTPAHAYRPGDTLPVAVRSSRDFMGFLLQARSVRDDRVVGSFVLVPPGSRTLGCVDAGDTVTHSDKLLKRNLSFVWRAPDTPLGDVRFLITVVQSYFVYWARIESDVVHDGTENSIGDEVGGVRALPGLWAEQANQTGAAETRESLNSAGQQGEGNPSLSPTLPTVSRGGPATPAPPTGPGNFTLHLDHARTRAKSPRPSVAAQPCLHCAQGAQAAQGAQGAQGAQAAQISVPPGPGDPPHVEPPQQSPLTAPGPQTEPTPSSPHLEPSPAPRRSQLDPATPRAQPHGTTPPPTPALGSRVLQKGVVARNLSRGGDAGLAGEGGAGGKGAGPAGGVSHRTALELGVLLGCASGLGMVLAVGLRYLHSQYCLKRTAVSLSERHGNVIHLQDSGELVQIRKIRQDSFVLLQAEYNVMTPPGN
ncbi:reelin domain-containing protein 1-like [Anguilla anguilla]|uniref:reelin domain-containing protein 1-like n=1 Tax=Anguilla anguilla TaxID=7936 RepID=UPI0015AB9B55|nr:reelin domain-containing protein 1-like [Anguilla anguilla]